MVANADDARLRAHVDDGAAALLEHHATCRLGAEEQAAEVHGHHLVPIGLGDILRRVIGTEAGVVDEHVQAAEVVPNMVHASANGGDLAHVHLDPQHPAAGSGDLGGGLVQRRPVAAGNRDRGPGTRQGGGDAAADASTCAGDQRDLPVQREIRLLHPRTLPTRHGPGSIACPDVSGCEKDQAPRIGRGRRRCFRGARHVRERARHGLAVDAARRRPAHP